MPLSPAAPPITPSSRSSRISTATYSIYCFYSIYSFYRFYCFYSFYSFYSFYHARQQKTREPTLTIDSLLRGGYLRLPASLTIDVVTLRALCQERDEMGPSRYDQQPI